MKTYAECDPVIQYWASGLIEGLATYQQISDFFLNLMDVQANSTKIIDRIKKSCFLQKRCSNY